MCETISTQDSTLESTELTGFSAAAVLDALSEPTTTQVTYLDGTSSSLTISVNYADGAIQLVEKPGMEADPTWDPQEPCLSHINIEATLVLSSEDGAIDVTESVNLKAYQVDYVTTAHEILSGAIVNLLEASTLNPGDNDRIRYYLDNAWREDTVTGNLMATVETNALSSEESSAETIVSISMNNLAEW